jgi:hypothetical protein
MFSSNKEIKYSTVLKNISRETYYHSALGKKDGIEKPHVYVLSHTIFVVNLSFCIGYHGNHFKPQHLYTIAILYHLLFLGKSVYFSIFEITTNFWFIGCIPPMCQKIRVPLHGGYNLLPSI